MPERPSNSTLDKERKFLFEIKDKNGSPVFFYSGNIQIPIVDKLKKKTLTQAFRPQ
jgi:hypothetical protein